MLLLQSNTAVITYSDQWFDFADPWSYDYDIKEIAHALSNICRYTGHSHRFYSVAEHCVHVSNLVPAEFALQGLLHDAAEAYLGDVAKPLKEMLPKYKEIEDETEAAIAHWFGCPWPYDKSVKEADRAMYWAERNSISSSNLSDDLWNQGVKPADVSIIGYLPISAERLFLDRYEEIANVSYIPTI